MASYSIGYSAAGAPLDYTTIASAVAGIVLDPVGDTFNLYYGDANKGTNHNSVNQDLASTLTFVGALGNQRVSIGEDNTWAFQQTTNSTTATFQNLTLIGGSNRQNTYITGTNTTRTYERCRFLSVDVNALRLGSAGTGAVLTFNSCEFIGTIWSLSIQTSSATVEFNNCAVLGYGVFGIDNAIGCTMSAYNTVVVKGNNASSGSCWYGTIGGSNNASDDGTAPGTGAVDLRLENTYMLMDGNGTNLQALSTRPYSDLCPLVGAGTDRSLTLDFDKQSIDQSTSANIGPYGVTANLVANVSQPTTPTFTWSDDGDGDNVTITWVADAGTTNYVKFMALGDSAYTTGGSGAGSGSATVSTGAPGDYLFLIESQLANAPTAFSIIQEVVVADTNASVSGGVCDIRPGAFITATLEENTETKGGTFGEAQSAWTTRKTISVWFQDISSAEKEEYAKRSLRVTHKVFTCTDPESEEGDRLTVSGTSYIIRGVVDQAGLGKVYRLDVEEVKT